MNYSRSNNIRARREHSSNKKKLKNKIGIIVFRVFIALFLIGGFAFMGAGIGAYVGIIRNAPEVNPAIRPDIFTSIIYDRHGEREIARLQGAENRIYVTSDQMPRHLKDAFIAIEDERFYQHDGVDFQGMLRAASTMVETRFARTEGASTITQQLIKNTVMGLVRNNVITKLQEQYMAVQYERSLREQWEAAGHDPETAKFLAKEHILEVYVNTIFLGRGSGVQTAAMNFFGKDVSELTISESAVLAAITQNPSRWRPDINPDNNRIRQVMVLENMRRLELITEEEFYEAYHDNVHDRVLATQAFFDDEASYHSYFVDALIAQLFYDIQNEMGVGVSEAANIIYNGGLRIYATKDERMQNIVDDVILDDDNFPADLFEIDIQYQISIKNNITGAETHHSKMATVRTADEVQPQIDAWKEELLQPHERYVERLFVIPQPQVGFVVMDFNNGEVKAISGGRGDKSTNRAFNRAVDAERQPGSVFKMLAAYAPAIEMGRIGPSTLIVDEPFTYAGHRFNNWWGANYRGPQTVRAGVEASMNILAVKTIVETGIDESFKILERFGFTTLVSGREINGQFFTDRTASLALGGLTVGVTPLEMTAAFAAIANEGFYNRPIFYTKVLDQHGNTIIDNTPQPVEIIRATTAYMLTDMMTGVMTSPIGTGHAARFRNINMPISGKTGTTSDAKDLAFVGYTPYYAAGIWAGFDQPRSMTHSDQGFHLRIWRDIMEEIHRDLEFRDFEAPRNVDIVHICQDSNLLATDFCWNDPRGSRVVDTPAVTGASPTERCGFHGIISVCNTSGVRANAHCPGTRTLTGIIVNDANIYDRSYQIPSSIFNSSYCTMHGQFSAPQQPPQNDVIPNDPPVYSDPWVDDQDGVTSATPIQPDPPPVYQEPPMQFIPDDPPWEPPPWEPPPWEPPPFIPDEPPWEPPPYEPIPDQPWDDFAALDSHIYPAVSEFNTYYDFP